MNANHYPDIEIWRTVERNTKYEVSNLGVCRRKNGGVLKGYDDGHGYTVISLSNGTGKRSAKKLHRLVAETFIPNPLSLRCVNHINGIKTDNRVVNLEWCTHSQNLSHSYLNGLRKPTRKIGADNLNSIPVIQIGFDGSDIKRWESISDVERELGISTSNISKCCKGVFKQTGGFKWKYL